MRGFDRDLIRGGHYGQRLHRRTNRPDTYRTRPMTYVDSNEDDCRPLPAVPTHPASVARKAVPRHYPRWEPGALAAPAGICAGARRNPRPYRDRLGKNFLTLLQHETDLLGHSCRQHPVRRMEFSDRAVRRSNIRSSRNNHGSSGSCETVAGLVVLHRCKKSHGA